MGSLLEIRDLWHRFGGVTALQELNLTVSSSEIVSIIGPNGAGKTTLFNCISGLYRPSSGSIRFQSEEITRSPPHRIAGLGIGRTFQNLELFKEATTMDNLMLGRHLKMRCGVLAGATMFGSKWPAAREESENRSFVKKIMQRLDLLAYRHRVVAELPYGIQKKVELGRALAMEPVLLLLDEPSAGMSREEREDLILMIQQLRTGLGLTILLIEHNMQMVQAISDHVLVINFGKSLTYGPPAEVAMHPEVTQAYLGVTDG